jgi:hypothetical protein
VLGYEEVDLVVPVEEEGMEGMVTRLVIDNGLPERLDNIAPA